jgi:hypothetical protein
MSADRDRGIRRQKQKRAKQQKKEGKQAFRSGAQSGKAVTGSARPAA